MHKHDLCDGCPASGGIGMGPFSILSFSLLAFLNQNLTFAGSKLNFSPHLNFYLRCQLRSDYRDTALKKDRSTSLLLQMDAAPAMVNSFKNSVLTTP